MPFSKKLAARIRQRLFKCGLNVGNVVSVSLLALIAAIYPTAHASPAHFAAGKTGLVRQDDGRKIGGPDVTTRNAAEHFYFFPQPDFGLVFFDGIAGTHFIEGNGAAAVKSQF